jgi:FkbM family methyltransferase
MPTLRQLLSTLARRARSALGISALQQQADALQSQLTRIEAALAPPPVPALPDYVAYTLPGGLAYELSLPAVDRDAFVQSLAAGATRDAPWRFLMDWVRPGDVFFDLGANLGSFSIPLAVHGAQVHAFELLYANLDHMAKSVARNKLKNMSLVLGALWDAPGAVGFAGHSAWGTVYGDTCTFLATLTIDDYVRSRQVARVDVLKIDIEGSEKQALRGAAQLLERDHPDIVIECNVLACGNNGYSYQELLAFLAARGYRFYRLHQRSLCPWAPGSVQEVVNADYLATTRTPEEIATRCTWPIAQLTQAESIAHILQQESYNDHHRAHVLAVAERLPAAVRDDPGVAALLSQWAPLAQQPFFRNLKTGAAPVSTDQS